MGEERDVKVENLLREEANSRPHPHFMGRRQSGSRGWLIRPSALSMPIPSFAGYEDPEEVLGRTFGG